MPPSPSDRDLFAPLAGLTRARKGIETYYVPLLKSDDEFVRIGAFCQLLNLEALPVSEEGEVIALSRYGAIKRRAFDYFKGRSLVDMASTVAEAKTADRAELLTEQMRAELVHDDARILKAQIALYLETGDTGALMLVAGAADRAGGWREATKWHVRAAAISPLEPQSFISLYNALTDANQYDLVDDLSAILSRAGLHPYPQGVYGAGSLLARGNAKGCIERIAKLPPPTASAPRSILSVLAHSKKLLGDANDRLGQFRESYLHYAEMNRLEQSATVSSIVDDIKSPGRVLQSSWSAVPSLSPSMREDVVMHLGFPRSGTTLLENILDAHPLIEAFEEQPMWDVAYAMVQPRRRAALGSSVALEQQLKQARTAYYREIDNRRKSATAQVLVDKYPMRTLFAPVLAKLFPTQKYIFSIRHPFDVTLSCFRQRFNPNAAMESFRTFKGAVELYDHTLTQWFAYHSIDDPLVLYLKYDDLVTNFDASVARTLDFIGLPWDDSVRDFAASSHNRLAATPSYQKIRQGLGIGVQTYWRNYRFLFDSVDARPLHKWAAFFGYETQ